MRRIVFDYFDVAYQARPCVSTLNEVVTQQSVAREPAIENLLYGINFIDPFSGKDAFPVKILINVRSSASINIEPGFSRINARKSRARGTLNAHSDTRLQDAITGDNDVLFRVNNCLVQRM